MKDLGSTERLSIRPLNQADLHDFHVYRSNPEVTRYQGFDVMDLDQALAFIDSQMQKEFGNAGVWTQHAIELKATGKLIGDCAIHLKASDPRIAEIGVTISHLEQRNGYSKEAMMGILGFLFQHQNVLRVEEIVDAENLSAIKALESMGFRKEGHFIENIFFKGKWGSEMQFAMLKREWDTMSG